MDRGANQHQIGAQLIHQIKLAGSAGEGAAAVRLWQALEIAERLEQGDFQPLIAHHPAHIGGREVRSNEILLENLDPVEPGIGDGLKLFSEGA